MGFFRRIVMFTVGTCVIAGEYPLSCPGTDETLKRIACGEEEREESKKAREKKQREKQKRRRHATQQRASRRKKHRRRYFTIHTEAESIAGRAKFFRFFSPSKPAHFVISNRTSLIGLAIRTGGAGGGAGEGGRKKRTSAAPIH